MDRPGIIVFNRFLDGFLDPKSMEKQHEEKRPRAILYCKNQYKIDVGAFATEAL